jgi:hypothetical protein
LAARGNGHADGNKLASYAVARSSGSGVQFGADEDRRDGGAEQPRCLRAFPALVQLGDGMNVLSDRRIQALAEKNGWPLVRAEGYLDGESFRRHGMTPSKYAKIGIDEYCLGFRAGYYERKNPELLLSGSCDTPEPISGLGL